MNEMHSFEQSRPLPPYRAVLAVDAKGFTDLPGSTHEGVAALIPRLAEDVMRESGLATEWANPEFYGHTGDGFAVGLPTRILPYLVHPFPALLQQRLEVYGRENRGAAPLRLRVSLHVGPLPADPTAPGNGGNGSARNETHRLLDSDVVKQALADASPRVTLVAMIVSDRVFQDVVSAGYAGLHPDHFVDVVARVKGKPFEQRAWLHLPAPSGSGLGAGRSAEPVIGPNSSTLPSPLPVASVGINHGQIAGIVHGGMHQSPGRPA